MDKSTKQLIQGYARLTVVRVSRAIVLNEGAETARNTSREVNSLLKSSESRSMFIEHYNLQASEPQEWAEDVLSYASFDSENNIIVNVIDLFSMSRNHFNQSLPGPKEQKPEFTLQ